MRFMCHNAVAVMTPDDLSGPPVDSEEVDFLTFFFFLPHSFVEKCHDSRLKHFFFRSNIVHKAVLASACVPTRKVQFNIAVSALSDESL